MLKIVCISDTHCAHSKLTIPPCDILIHAGDFSWTGKFGEVCDFVSWLKQQPAKHKIFVCGNHELSCDKYHRKYDPSIRDMLINSYDDSIHYLENQSVTIDGVKFYGTPWTPEFHGWAFNGLESGRVPFTNYPALKDIYGRINDDTNVLICHGPCYGCADQGGGGNDDERLGSMDLLRRTQELKDLKLVIGGHIHEARGMVKLLSNDVVYANVSTLDRDYKTVRSPVVFELDANKNIQSIQGY